MNKVVTSYIIVTADIVVLLSMDVNQHLSKGWQPIGGVCFDGQRYLQAMVKYEGSKE